MWHAGAVRAPRLLVPLAAAVFALAGCGTIPSAAPASSAAPSAADTSTPIDVPSVSGSSSPSGSKSTGAGTCAYTPNGQSSKPVDLPPTSGVPTTGSVAYTLKLPNGSVRISMDRRKTPCTINSFVSLAEQGYYDGTQCHRLADSGIFVLQCGDPSATGTGGPGYTFPDELTGQETYGRGVVAMANGGPNTNGSQFFLVWDTTELSPDYTVFGQMDAAGRDVVAGIASQGQDGSNPDGTGKPNAPATIESVKVAR